MVNSGSLDVLPLSPCTNGSLGFGSQLLGGTLLRHVETSSTADLVEHTSTEVAEVAEEVNVDSDTLTGEDSHTDKRHVQEKHADEDEDEDVDIETVDEEVDVLTEKVAVATSLEDVEGDTQEEEEEGEEKEEQHENETDGSEETTPEVVKFTPTPAARPESPTVQVSTSITEKMASGIPQRAVLSGTPTAVQSRGLSAASLALKKKQAAENAAAALKAVAVEIPETDSISNRIRMFGGAAQARTGGLKKCNVRDMVQKFKDLAENETRAGIAKMFGGMVNSSSSHSSVSSSSSAGYNRNDDNDRLGVSQESVQSVKNAKSLFENLARNEASGAQ
ncbi:hypothetical protein BGZ95_005666, partial [Linnemannia exigua]